MFKKLEIKGWRQYQNIEIDFHDRLTVITGANGAGKTTLLNILNRHFGWTINLVSTPKRRITDGIVEFATDIWGKIFGTSEEQLQAAEGRVGRIFYSDGKHGTIKVPISNAGPTYQFSISEQQQVRGLHIPSHRPTFVHQEVGTMPTRVLSRQQLFQNYSSEIRNRHINGAGGRAPNYYLKEALISLATFGYGNQVVASNPDAVRLFEGFQDILKVVLPPKLGFRKISIEMPEVVLDTESGKFSIDAASGGVTAIIDLAWQIYTFAEQDEIKDQSFVVTIDEPENHLHPEMQKVLLRNFIKAFPRAQFIVATHNPFIVTSIPDSNVYVLKYDDEQRVNDERKVQSFLLDRIEKAASSNEILREVLGLSSTLPHWAEEKLQAIIEKYSTSANLGKDTLQAFRNEMREIGFEKFIPEALSEVVEQHDQTR